jgi:TIR domain
MADIFISYKSERRPAAEHFAEVLRRHGFTVWFDYDLVKGRDFARQIDAEIRRAKALIVLWCNRSVTSEWVLEEAQLAKRLGILIPVKIESCELPFGFGRDDTIDLSAWDGNPRSHSLDPLLNDLELKVGKIASPDRRALMEYEAAWRRFGARSPEDFALAAEPPFEAPRPELSLEKVSEDTLQVTQAKVEEYRRKLRIAELEIRSIIQLTNEGHIRKALEQVEAECEDLMNISKGLRNIIKKNYLDQIVPPFIEEVVDKLEEIVGKYWELKERINADLGRPLARLRQRGET